MYWEIPKLWTDETCVLLGGGPSLPGLLEGKRFNRCPVIAVNDAFRLCSDAAVCFFGDTKWYWWNKEDLKSFKGLKVSCDKQPNPAKVKDTEIGSVKKELDVKIIRYSSGYGITIEPNRVRFNSSSGACAINLAWHLGAKRIVLVGYDMRVINGERNWRRHNNWQPGQPKGFEAFLKCFDYIAEDASGLGLDILNATPKSGIKNFPFISLESLCELWTSTKQSNA
jgi:hypothetical protein